MTAPLLEIMSKTEMEVKKDDCLFEQGSFWEWDKKECVKQGRYGFDSKQYPAEQWGGICQDGFTCKVHAKFEETAAEPSPTACLVCAADNNCKWGMERHTW